MYLAIETSTPTGSVAVGTGAIVLAEVVLSADTKHAEALLPAVDFALRTAGVDRHELTRIVVGGGPGSFTGLRIAAATAKALAAVLNLPLYAYSGLAALAAGSGIADRVVCALFDARRGEVYAASYRFRDHGKIETLLEPAPRTIQDVLALIEVGETTFVGDGAHANAAAIRAANGVIAPESVGAPRAAALLWLSDRDAAGLVPDRANWEPLYLRESGAERMRIK